mgnify:CR=1 FL=1
MKMSFKNTWVALRERSVSESIPEEHFTFLRSAACFSARYPDVKLIPCEESTEQMIRHLLAGELDFAIVNESSSHPLLEYRPLYEVYGRCCLRRAPTVHRRGKEKPERSMSEDRSQTI